MRRPVLVVCVILLVAGYGRVTGQTVPVQLAPSDAAQPASEAPIRGAATDAPSATPEMQPQVNQPARRAGCGRLLALLTLVGFAALIARPRG